MRSFKRHAVLGAIVALLVVPRLCHIGAPWFIDFHSWRQSDSAAFVREYLVETLNPLDPRADRYPCALRDRPFGRVEAELPVVGWLSALPLAALGMHAAPAWYLRTVTLATFVIACFYLAAMMRRLGASPFAERAAVIAFGVMPISVFFTRSPQPDGPALLFGIGMLYHLLAWLDGHRSRDIRASAAFGSVLLLLKISNGYWFIVAAAMVFMRLGVRKAFSTVVLYLWAAVVLLPGLLWAVHAAHQPWTFGVLTDAAASMGKAGAKIASLEDLGDRKNWSVLFRRLTHEVILYPGLAFIAAGAFLEGRSRAGRLALVWSAVVVVFTVLTLPGQQPHAYYQLAWVFPGAMLIGLGAHALWCLREPASFSIGRGAVIVFFVAALCEAPRALWGFPRRVEEIYFANEAGLESAVKLIRAEVGDPVFVSSDSHPALFTNAGKRGFFEKKKSVKAYRACMEGQTRFLLLDKGTERELQDDHKQRKRLATAFEPIGTSDRHTLYRLRDKPQHAAKSKEGPPPAEAATSSSLAR